jgi:hypothetical protein
MDLVLIDREVVKFPGGLRQDASVEESMLLHLTEIRP